MSASGHDDMPGSGEAPNEPAHTYEQSYDPSPAPTQSLPAADQPTRQHAAFEAGSVATQPDETRSRRRQKKERAQTPFWKELPVLVLIAFGLALLIKSFFIQAFFIPSPSMVPTLEVGDRVLVNKVITRIREPRRGEIIVFVGERDTAPRSFWQRLRDTLTSGFGGAQPAERDFIKRVIGLPGETVLVQDGKVTITPADGRQSFTLKESYIASQKDPSPFGPFKVPDGTFFVMGDNRPNSSDSRASLGPIKRSDIVGKAFVRIWPISRFKALTRPSYALAVPLVMMGLVQTGFSGRRRRAA